jgi:hypothetical protein
MKFTFRKQPRITGKAGIGYPIRSIDIKLRNKKVGQISAPNWLKDWEIWVTVLKKDIMEDKNPNCEWRNVRLAILPVSDEDAKEYLQENIEKIIEKFTLYSLDTDEYFSDGKWSKI